MTLVFLGGRLSSDKSDASLTVEHFFHAQEFQKQTIYGFGSSNYKLIPFRPSEDDIGNFNLHLVFHFSKLTPVYF